MLDRREQHRLAWTVLATCRIGVTGSTAVLVHFAEGEPIGIAGLRRTTLKLALQIVGLAALLVGLLWIGQGLGLVHWPASSFMLDQRPWALRGGLLALIGLIVMLLSRRP